MRAGMGAENLGRWTLAWGEMLKRITVSRNDALVTHLFRCWRWPRVLDSETGSPGPGSALDSIVTLGKVLRSWASAPVEMETRICIPRRVVGQFSGLVCRKAPGSWRPSIQVSPD